MPAVQPLGVVSLCAWRTLFIDLPAGCDPAYNILIWCVTDNNSWQQRKRLFVTASSSCKTASCSGVCGVSYFLNLTAPPHQHPTTTSRRVQLNFFLPQAGPSPAISTAAAFVCQSKEACGKGYGSDLFSARADAGAEVLPPGSPAAAAAEAAAAGAADKVYYVARGLPPATNNNSDNPEMADMRRQIASGMRRALAYEDGALQAKARAVLPPEGGGVVQKGAEMAAAGGFSQEEGLARALLR